jgi:hypothetical protein
MSKVYGSSVEALSDLLSSQHVAEVTADLSYLTKGIAYSFVQVTCEDGNGQYGLQAYWKEAEVLNKIAVENQIAVENPSVSESQKSSQSIYPMAISS